MAGIVADRVRDFLEAPAAYLGIPSAAAAGLLGSLQVHTDPQLLAGSGIEEWVYVSPGAAPVRTEQPNGLSSIGLYVRNSVAPQPLGDGGIMRFAEGSVPTSGYQIIVRTVSVAVSAGTRAGAARAADALHMWLADIVDFLAVDFGCRKASLSEVRLAGEAERPLFAGFAGNIAVMDVVATTLRSNTRSVSNPL